MNTVKGLALIFTLLLLGVHPLYTQEATPQSVTVVTREGDVVEGRLVDMSTDELVLKIVGQEISLPLDRGGPHPLDRFSSQLRWNPIHDSSCFVCWLSSSPSVSVRFLRRPAVERRVGPAPVVEVHPQADSSPGLGARSELGQVDALVFE